MTSPTEAVARAEAWLTDWKSPREVWTDCEPLAQEAASIISTLLAELAEARAVIEPFAEAGFCVPSDRKDFQIVAVVPGGHNAEAFRKMGKNLTAGNLRRASEFIRRVEGTCSHARTKFNPFTGSETCSDCGAQLRGPERQGPRP